MVRQIGICAFVCLLAISARGEERMRALLRRPAALALNERGDRLFVANRRSGTISIIDLQSRQVVEEITIGGQLADLICLPGGARLLTVDQEQHQLILVERQGGEWKVARRAPVRPYPVSVAVSPDGSWAFVASLWSRSLSVVAFEQQSQLETVQALRLPFAPRKQLLLAEEDKLIVADAFGGKLALFDLAAGDLDVSEAKRIVEIPAHNIRGLAFDAPRRKLLVSHQILDNGAESTRQNVHWGALLTDVVRWIEFDSFLTAPPGRPLDSHVHQFGGDDGAGGDPAGVAVTSEGTLIQMLAGVGKAAIGGEWGSERAMLSIGRRPTELVLDRAERLAYVADTFGDAIVVIDVPGEKKLATISLGSQPELSLVDRGELLFYDARLSLDGWYSCHSCHTDGHTNGQLTDNLGDGGFGAPKRVLSLLGTGETGPWAWSGAVPALETQIRKSIVSTMQGRQPDEDQVAALAAYLRSLAPPPPLGSLFDRDPAAVERGRKVFDAHECGHCHAPPAYSSKESFDVGLKDESGASQFNPPSLRGVSQGGPFFHDNRAATLEAVFRDHKHPGDSRFSEQELQDLLAFLNSI
jgi:YVTN family beta-propeller protein